MTKDEALQFAADQGVSITGAQAIRVAETLWPLAERTAKDMQGNGEKPNVPYPLIKLSVKGGIVQLELSIIIS